MDAGLIAMRMRLSGGKEVAAEAQTATAAVEETSAATETANKKVGRTGSAISNSLSKQITAMRTIGRSLTKYITVPIAALAIGSGVMAAHFDRSMNLVATDAGGSVKEVARLKGEVLDMARHSQFGPQALADSLFHVESSGYRGAKALRVLNEAQRLATTGNSDLQSTTYALVSATKALYGESLKNVNRTAAELNGIVAHGDMRLEELTSAMSTGVIPKAKAMGLTLRDVGAAMDVMTSRGIPAQRAAYALGFTLQKLVPYGEKAEDAFKSIGLGQETLINAAQHGKYGYVSALEVLQQHLDRLPKKAQQTKVIEEMFGGGRMTSGLLTNLQNLDEMRKIYGELGDEVHKYNNHVREAENQPMVKAQRAWSSIEAGLIEIGQVLLPAAIPLMEHVATILAGVASGFAHLPPATQHTIVLIAGIAAALGPVLLLVAKLLELWKSINELTLVQKGTAGMTKGRLAGATAGVLASQVAGNAIGGKAGSAISNIGTGAAVGFGVGGPWGAAAGAGLGALLTFGPDLVSLFQTEKKINPLQAKLAQSAKGMASAYKGAREQVRALKASEEAVASAQKRHHGAQQAATKAQHALNAARRQSGPNSQAAIKAEVRYSQAIRGVTAAKRAQKRAEREHGVELEVTKEKLRFAILEERHRINVLGQSRGKIEAHRQALKEEGASLQALQPVNERLSHLTEQLRKAQQAQANTILEAGKVAGPRFAQMLKQGGRATVEYGSKVKATRHELNTMKTTLREVQRAIKQTSDAFEAGVLGQQGNVLRQGIENAEGQLEGLQNHPHRKGGHHRNTAAGPSETNGSSAVKLMFDRRSKGKTVHHQPVILALDPQGRRRLAEGVVEVQEDDEAML